MNNARKPLSALIALGAALALPAAFAQDANTPTTTQTPPTQSTTAAPAGQQTITWADLDVDGNGELTAEEYKAYVAQANGSQPGASNGN
jgi:predicted outer membrane protein